MVGINDDAIAQHQFGESKTLNISTSQVTGEIVGVTIIRSEDDAGGGGAILKEALDLFFFRSDPSLSAGDAVLLIADANTSLGHISVVAGDYAANMSGTDTAGLATTQPLTFPFKTDSSGNLFVALANRGATTINSAAGDDERVELTIYFKLFS